MADLQIPSFSNPTNRTDYQNVTNMLTNFFVSKGFKQSDAAAQAGLVLNLKQQGYTDAQINTAIQTQQNTLNSIAANQAAQAAAALAAEQPKIAATLALSAAAKAKEGANYGGNQLITVNGVTETRDQAANFADNSVGEMVANPNDPRGALITRAQYDQIIAQNKLSTGSNTSLIATTPNVSKVVAINGVPVAGATDPTKTSNTILGTSEPITDASKALSTVVKQATTDLNKTTTNPATVPATPTPDTKTSSNPLSDFIKTITDAISPVTKPASDALTSTEKTLSDAISATQKTIGDATSQAVTDVQKTFADTLASAEKSAADIAAAASKSASDAQKQTTDFLTNAETTIGGLIAKFTGAVSSIPDPTKTTTPPPPTPPPTPTPTPTPQPQPAPQQTFSEKAKAFLQKYSTPIVLSIAGAGAIGSLAFVMSHNGKQGIIQR